MPETNLNIVRKFAKDYDKSILKNNWTGPKIIFDESKVFISPKSKIVDLGIGTGASSVLFQQAGYKITGLDGSPEMLELCKKKQIADKLVLHNLEKTPFPLAKNIFETAISNGVLHLINPVKSIFSEVARILKPNGIFAFTFDNTDNVLSYTKIKPGVWETKTQDGVFVYKYSEQYILQLLLQNNFEIEKQKQFLAYTNPELQKKFNFTLIVAKMK
ncbi:MAG: class I SAM-dependent methyltransferase [Prolixibacteraceae bacterium]|jgi:ubiquinone/menaquinone biosynthesis C-methylase UbiE|nr:class I SAM-dependent methyltransferase [Prolixibacteraceae bacterium]MBT6006036.1 class I SAM-dependent methyltransferase [Prolixibacteraceae bacterium]MBT6764701.1 class I SAM-dependent methyltransferase [Prolixibacteraceae bacterium]MBT6997936.1 class I SAM-dependent methyltransferase [Prolixibacteraceae bacterium]MBT7396054.1 class I SAM-dependent methyltransferase [Prolixibacteraceae bacterium]